MISFTIFYFFYILLYITSDRESEAFLATGAEARYPALVPFAELNRLDPATERPGGIAPIIRIFTTRCGVLKSYRLRNDYASEAR